MMRDLRAQSRLCDRARGYVSYRLDEELSDFERALLDNHLERCEPCSLLARELEQIVMRLRSAPLEELAHPITLPSRRRRTRAIQVTAAAAAAAAVAVMAGLVGSRQFQGPANRPVINPAAVANSIDLQSQDIQELHDLNIAAKTPDRSYILGGPRPT
jgi:anti-sigma factor RsiW